MGTKSSATVGIKCDHAYDQSILVHSQCALRAADSPGASSTHHRDTLSPSTSQRSPDRLGVEAGISGWEPSNLCPSQQSELATGAPLLYPLRGRLLPAFSALLSYAGGVNYWTD